MGDFIRLVGPTRAVEIFGVKLVGVTEANARKLLFTLLFLMVVLLLARAACRLAGFVLSGRRNERVAFWTQQAIALGTAILILLGVVSIWFDDPARLTTAAGLLTAGLAFALQKVITAVAGYFVILRGKTFNVGDRITMGGVRGDVIALGFIQTTIMEMGQPPSVQDADPAMWVRSRQYTGRIVTVTNDKIFDEPVFNYTRDFPYIWEEMSLPIPYSADRDRAERLLLEAVRKLTVPIGAMSEEALHEMERRYVIKRADMGPRVYFRLTDNWLELTARFIAKDHEIRALKDAISRELLRGLDEAGIPIASATYDIVGLPPIRIQHDVSAVRANGPA